MGRRDRSILPSSLCVRCLNLFNWKHNFLLCTILRKFDLERIVKQPLTKIHSAYRSLIQKAVRRGDLSLTRKVASHLRDIGDGNWLARRTAVITFEECWPLGAKLDLSTEFTNTVNSLIRAAQSVKVKDATGLGTLAYALSTGDDSVLSGSPEDRHIKIVSEAIKRPKDFWDWVTTNCSQESQSTLVDVAQKAYRRGGWPWDRAFMQAAAYLAVTGNTPIVTTAKQQSKEFPLWVALDKHTPQGKQALRHVAKKIGVLSNQLFWVSFYFESALTNEATDSFWWSKEVNWRLHQIGLDFDRASLIWDKAQPIISEILKAEVEDLWENIQPPTPLQLSLFDLTDFRLENEQPIYSQEIPKTEVNHLQ